jgi:hypothetical protein
MAEQPLFGKVVGPIPDSGVDFVHVTFPLQDGGQQVVACRWPGGNKAPNLGDHCVVVFTDEYPWALGLPA